MLKVVTENNQLLSTKIEQLASIMLAIIVKNNQLPYINQFRAVLLNQKVLGTIKLSDITHERFTRFVNSNRFINTIRKYTNNKNRFAINFVKNMYFGDGKKDKLPSGPFTPIRFALLKLFALKPHFLQQLFSEVSTSYYDFSELSWITSKPLYKLPAPYLTLLDNKYKIGFQYRYSFPDDLMFCIGRQFADGWVTPVLGHFAFINIWVNTNNDRRDLNLKIHCVYDDYHDYDDDGNYKKSQSFGKLSDIIESMPKPIRGKIKTESIDYYTMSSNGG